MDFAVQVEWASMSFLNWLAKDEKQMSCKLMQELLDFVTIAQHLPPSLIPPELLKPPLPLPYS